MQEKCGRDFNEVLCERIAKQEHEEQRRKQLHEEAAVFRAAHEEIRQRHELRLLGLESDESDDDDYEVQGDPIISDDEDVIDSDALHRYSEIANCSFDVQADETFTKDTFLCDNGASCHFTNSLEGMTNLYKHDGQIKIGDGKPMKATMIETKHGCNCNAKRRSFTGNVAHTRL
jgi:hypothetical protein